MSRRHALGIAIGFSMIAPGLVAQSTPNFGTSEASYVTIGPGDFGPLDSGDAYRRGYLLWATGGTGNFTANVHLPSGALLSYFELDYCDDNGGANHVSVQLVLCPTVGGCSSPLGLSSLVSTSNGCSSVSADISSFNFTVDNATDRLYLVLNTPSLDNSNQMGGVIVGYKLQVSPAPGSATFNDVPTSHPFFQYIEALHASGITAGCQASPPLYCPDSPVTRGQMAVFLAKALGLFWPN